MLQTSHNGRMTIADLFPDAGLQGRDLRTKAPGWFRGYDVADFPGLTADMFLGRGKDRMKRQDIMAMYNPTQATPTPETPAAQTPATYQRPTPNNVFAQYQPLTFSTMLARQPTL